MKKTSVKYLTSMGLDKENAERLSKVLNGEHNEFNEESINFKEGTDCFVWGDLTSENYEGRFMQTPVGFFIKLKNSSSKIQYFISNTKTESIKVNTLVDFNWTTSLIQKVDDSSFSIKTHVVDPETFHMITDGRRKILNMDMDLYEEIIIHASNDIKQDVLETEIEANDMIETFNLFVENPNQILVTTPKM